MKKGFWNYTEPIIYTVILAKIKKVDDPPLHWQNAFVGEERQIVEIMHENDCFYIDNGDGSGLKKIAEGGGFRSYHASVDNFDLIRELPEDEWQQPDPVKREEDKRKVEAWQRENYPEHFRQLERLMKSFKRTGKY